MNKIIYEYVQILFILYNYEKTRTKRREQERFGYMRSLYCFRPKKEGDSDHEEEFYYTEREVMAPAPPPTLSHRDMCRPPHEDPEYQRQLVGSYRYLTTATCCAFP